MLGVDYAAGPRLFRDATGLVNVGDFLDDVGTSLDLWKSDEEIAAEQRRVDNEVYRHLFNDGGYTLEKDDELYAEFQEWLSEGPNAGALKHSGDEYIILGGAQMDRAGARSLVRLRGAVGEYLKTGNRELGNRLA